MRLTIPVIIWYSNNAAKLYKENAKEVTNLKKKTLEKLNCLMYMDNNIFKKNEKSSESLYKLFESTARIMECDLGLKNVSF